MFWNILPQKSPPVHLQSHTQQYRCVPLHVLCLTLQHILLPTLTAAAFAALYAEFLAWFMGAPATLFLIPALLIPLVPGRPLYYAMYYAVQQDMDLSADFARQTALYALGIALGASLVWALADMRRHLKQNGFGN